jgi:hypothetical protein
MFLSFIGYTDKHITQAFSLDNLTFYLNAMNAVCNMQQPLLGVSSEQYGKAIITVYTVIDVYDICDQARDLSDADGVLVVDDWHQLSSDVCELLQLRMDEQLRKLDEFFDMADVDGSDTLELCEFQQLVYELQSQGIADVMRVRTKQNNSSYDEQVIHLFNLAAHEDGVISKSEMALLCQEYDLISLFDMDHPFSAHAAHTAIGS